MLDLETLGNRPGSAPFSIGAVRVVDGEVEAEDLFYCRISPQDAIRQRLRTDIDTMLWWMRQGEAARAELMAAHQDGAPLAGVLDSFLSWYDKRPAEQVWCKGASFDFPILDAAFRVCNRAAPWHFAQQSCYRTLAKLYPKITATTKPDIPHHAGHDAVAQAHHLVTLLRAVNQTH